MLRYTVDATFAKIESIVAIVVRCIIKNMQRLSINVAYSRICSICCNGLYLKQQFIENFLVTVFYCCETIAIEDLLQRILK